eukprot:CAMPEP_0176501420 /NCGR_PEP_ID=MMETSP0200_2-20121128/14151_1 /TAXON_ID=947934 /ORGANISM="Chaetoceros sp., Strain GSL56" /LENGTH=322 /DNA_ID=CAMNT_0017900305 /DNA_START=40 /DNA_END=1005 /DNA_ORIENTATION=-
MKDSASIITYLTIFFNAWLLNYFHGVSAFSFASNTTTNSNSNANDFTLSSFLHRLKDNGLENMELIDMIFCGCIIILGMEFMDMTTKQMGRLLKLKTIPVRGKHLDDLEAIDMLYITLNKIATVPFVYCLVKYMYNEPNAVWALDSLTLQNTLLTIPPFFIIYDFFYTILHWALHIQAVYGYIHKHHHRQKAPSRANMDAVNVHPIEFFLGEYNHLLAIYIYCHVLGMKMHVVALNTIFSLSPILTGLNHTRWDSKVSILGWTLYDSKWHDVHHRIPQSNYGQYTNFWDLVFRTFRPYNPEDRVNPENQLGENGKSLNYGKK